MSLAREDALIALQAKNQAERHLAQLSLCPPSRHAAFAAVIAILVVSPALPMPVRFAAIAVAFASIVLIVQWDKKRLGVFINGYRRGKTRLVVIPLLVITMALYLASSYFAEFHGRARVALVLAAVAFAVAYIGSTIWQRVFVRELGA
jgi:phosphotransferase system  glucose/maltose/N-acetylglucosamine-specific IIC component